MKSIKLTDTDGQKWRVWVHEWYAEKITRARVLKNLKQKAADDLRAKGWPEAAKVIESQTVIGWCQAIGILSKRELIK